MYRPSQRNGNSIVAIVAILAIALIAVVIFRVIQQRESSNGGIPDIDVNLNDTNDANDGDNNPLY